MDSAARIYMRDVPSHFSRRDVAVSFAELGTMPRLMGLAGDGTAREKNANFSSLIDLRVAGWPRIAM